MMISRRINLILLGCLTAGFAARLSASETSPAASAPVAAQPADHVLADSDLLSLLTAALQKDYVKDKGELELKLNQPWTSHKVPNEPLTLKIQEMPTIGVSSSFIVRFELQTEHTNLGSWQVPVQAHIWRDVWVAHSILKRGDSLIGADVARERRDMLAIHEPLAEFSTDDETIAIAEPVGVGAPLFARSIMVKPVVHRGQLVNAVVEDGSLSVSMKVEALEDGVPGQIVRARNQQTLRDIRGKVLNEQTIVVFL
jgi:flagella basal body P-ring formation protein FlgA